MARLPDFAHRFFWDVDPARLDPEAYPEYVIERLLEHGDLRSVRWMLNNFPPPQIVRVLKTSRRLSAFSANFWALFFDVDKENVLCLSTPSLREPGPTWPY